MGGGGGGQEGPKVSRQTGNENLNYRRAEKKRELKPYSEGQFKRLGDLAIKKQRPCLSGQRFEALVTRAIG